jgi:MraZ protein
MFIGEYQHTIDEKGRLAVPAKFRALLKGGAVVTKGLDNCLFLYPKKEWQKMAVKLSRLSVAKANNRAIGRHMLAGGMAVDFDNQGRIGVPDYLRQFAGLSKKVIIAGLFDRLEIWDEAAWNEFKAGAEKNSTSIAEALGELGGE